MALKQKNTIGRKITLVVLTAVIAAVFSATGFFMWRTTNHALDARYHQLKATAFVFASVISKHVKNNDRTQTRVALRAIGKMPDIPYAVVSRADGTMLASLGTAIVLTNQSTTGSGKSASKSKPSERSVLSLINSTTLPVAVPIINGGANVGRLLLLADVSDLRAQLLDGFFLAAVAVVFASLLGMIIATRMKKGVTAPIIHLARAMATVRETHDFTTRVERESDDETGQLVDSFNEMLSQISERDGKLAHHRATLEQTVEERTRELSVAKVAAEQANMAKSDFLATMSHEIRTPMNGVMVMAELLAGANLMPRQQRYAEVIVRSGQSLLTIINDILDLSKIEAGKLELEQVPTSPAGIVDDVISLFWQKASSKKVDIASFVDVGVPTKIVGDPVRLNQVLSNLVNNALKFTETGYVAISVRVVLNEAGQTVLEFSVTDTGIGIAKDKLSSVFQEFTQADQTTTRKFGGTGLGLSICKKLVAAMNGLIDVESVVNRGSRFYFQIPVEVVEAGEPATDCRHSQMQRAVVVLDGLASKQSVAGYLGQSGVGVSMLDPDDAGDVELYANDAVFACASVISKMPRRGDREAKPFMIAVSQLGDVAGEDLVRQGVADDIIIRPVGQREMIAMIERLANGAPRKMAAVEQSVQARKPLPQFSAASVLIADDNAVNREVIIEVLRQLGVSASVAKDGREAVDMWSAGSFDMIFMDCSMPVLDGYAATSEIRRIESGQGKKPVPVIALTAHIAGDNAEKWQNAGMNAFITKPFTIKTIAERMGELLPASLLEEPKYPVVVEPVEQLIETIVSEPVPVAASVQPVKEEMPVLDEEVMTDLRESGGGSDALLMRVFDLFIENAPGSFDEIEKVSASSDQEALADAAHALKSMSANIGAAKTANACHVVELAARQGEEIDLGAAIAKISSTLHEALGAIEQVKAQAS